jgi:hypothetical protein
MAILEKDQKLYRALLKSQVSRESALSLVLVAKGLKDAATVGFNKPLAAMLKKNGYICERDESYLRKSIHGFIEHTTKIALPGAPIVRRLYVGKRISRQRLKRLKSGSNFEQGLGFGFPVCDIINYCRKEKTEGKGYIEVFQDWLDGLPAQNGFKYVDFRLMGGLLKYFQASRFIVHIPHRHNCPASLELAERNLSLLERLDCSFKNSLVNELKKPLLLYGNGWDNIGLLQLARVKRLGRYLYRAQYSRALPPIAGGHSSLRIKLIPHKKVEIYSRNKKLLQRQSAKSLSWSYSFIFPYDSKKELECI